MLNLNPYNFGNFGNPIKVKLITASPVSLFEKLENRNIQRMLMIETNVG